jgi:hypothetical protein
MQQRIVRVQALGEATMKIIAFIALIMEAVRISETSVYFNETTRRYIPES